MMLTIFLFAAMQPEMVDGPPTEWLAQNMPYGLDVTRDGKVWIPLAPVGKRDDYAVLGNDYYRIKQALEKRPTVWMRGYHLRNADVSYRETKMLINFDCPSRMYTILRTLRYDADGRVVESIGRSASDYIVPGTHAESWDRTICSHVSR